MLILTKARRLSAPLERLGTRVAGVVSGRSTSRDESGPVFAGTGQPRLDRGGLPEQEPKDALPAINRPVDGTTEASPVPEEVSRALEGLASPVAGVAAAAEGQPPIPVGGWPQPSPPDRAPVAAKKEAPSMMATDLMDIFAVDEEVNEEFGRLISMLGDVDINDLVLQANEVTMLIGRRKQR